MSWLASILTTIQGVLPAVGSVVDAAVPVAVGDRTKWSALIAVAAPLVQNIACSVYPPACPIVSAIGAIAGTLTPFFAGAGLVRAAAPAKV